MQTGTSGKRHVDICMIMAEDEMIHLVVAFEFRCKLIKRLIRTLEDILTIMRKTAMAGPCISQTVGKPRMEHAEQDLKRTTVEDGADDPVAERHITQTVTMTEAESFTCNIHYTRLLKTLHSKLLEITVCPDIVVARKEID